MISDVIKVVMVIVVMVCDDGDGGGDDSCDGDDDDDEVSPVRSFVLQGPGIFTTPATV